MKKAPDGAFFVGWMLSKSEVDDLVVCRGGGFHHRLAQRGVGVDRLDDFVAGGLQLADGDDFSNHLGDIGSNHVPSEEFAILGVEDELHESVLVSGGACLA